MLLLSSAHAGTLRQVGFEHYSPLAANLELLRRLTSPLKASALPEILAHSKERLAAQAIDLSREIFVLYIPSQQPPQGYGLLVFVPPWPEARLPDGWASVLDQHGVIFVSAANSGNDASPMGRREPLALLAEQNVVAQYTVDPARIYVAGFSGGSRVAMRLALGYPDLFRGAILDAGSDPIGNAQTPLPPRDLFLRFQSDTHLVYVTGDEDLGHLGMAAVSMHSMRDWCVFGIDSEVIARGGHEAANPAALSRALEMLDDAAPPDPATLASCGADIEKNLASEFGDVEALIAAGTREEARATLSDIDAHYGGLAAPRSLELRQKIEAMH